VNKLVIHNSEPKYISLACSSLAIIDIEFQHSDTSLAATCELTISHIA